MAIKFYPFRKSTTLAAFLMVLSASFTRQLMEFATSYIGKGGFKILICSIFIALALIFFIIEAKRLANPVSIFVMLALLAIILFYVWKIKLPQVRMHILMYAVVGWLATRDATKPGRTWRAIITAWLFAAIAGTSEELLQKMLPYRVFEVSDIIYNIKGVTIGVVLYLIGQKGIA
jgi:hypothetical protein